MERKSEMIQAAEGFLRNSKSKVARSELRRVVKQAAHSLTESGGERCYECGKATKYNGWKNYETWAVALWIDNEEGTHERRREMAREATEGAEPMYGLSAADIARSNYSDALKEWAESDLIPELPASLASDLLGAALSEVDWYEIAGNWLGEE